jgi:hypothetical protein
MKESRYFLDLGVDKCCSLVGRLLSCEAVFPMTKACVEEILDWMESHGCPLAEVRLCDKGFYLSAMRVDGYTPSPGFQNALGRTS